MNYNTIVICSQYHLTKIFSSPIIISQSLQLKGMYPMESKAKPLPTSIRLDPELYSKVAKLAQEEHRSVSKQIEHIIHKYFQMVEK